MTRETASMRRRREEKRDESRSAQYRRRIGLGEEGEPKRKPKRGEGDQPTESAQKAQRALDELSQLW